MNYILFLTVLVILLLYVYYIFFKKEPFQCFKSQLYHYTYSNDFDNKMDAGIMNDFDKDITFDNIEYKNLEERIKKNNQENMTDDEIRTSIIGNLKYDEKIKTEDNYSIQKKEISIIQMDAVLNLMLLDNRYRKKDHNFKLFTEEIDKNKYSYKLIKKFLLVELSKQADNEIFKNKYITSFNFKLINDHIISYSVDYDNNYENYEIQMIVYRDKKNINYTLYIDIVFDNYNVKYYIKKLFVVGVNLKQRVLFDNLIKSPNDNANYTLLKDIPNISDKNIANRDKDADTYLKDDKLMRNQYKEDDRGFCFFKRNIQNKIQCESVDENGTGVWDKSCIYDEDCPYYKRNRNYPNSRGGCKNGYCEMPLNLKRFGYKQINDGKLDSVICYNCKKEKDSECEGLNCNKCCEEQKDKSKYPNLSSPDYAFDRDFNERIKNRQYLIS